MKKKKSEIRYIEDELNYIFFLFDLIINNFSFFKFIE